MSLQGHPDPEIYQRWVAFGLFSSHSRLHGSSSYRVPWTYGEDAAKTMSKFVEAKHRLMPYLYNLVRFALFLCCGYAQTVFVLTKRKY